MWMNEWMNEWTNERMNEWMNDVERNNHTPEVILIFLFKNLLITELKRTCKYWRLEYKKTEPKNILGWPSGSDRICICLSACVKAPLHFDVPFLKILGRLAWGLWHIRVCRKASCNILNVTQIIDVSLSLHASCVRYWRFCGNVFVILSRWNITSVACCAIFSSVQPMFSVFGYLLNIPKN